jgi:hypothetical protein
VDPPTSTPFEQSPGPHEVPAGGYWHVGWVPSQVLPHWPLPGQVPFVGGPGGAVSHSPLALHRWHTPVHAVAQHTPVAQMFDEQRAAMPPEHGAPSGRS